MLWTFLKDGGTLVAGYERYQGAGEGGEPEKGREKKHTADSAKHARGKGTDSRWKEKQNTTSRRTRKLVVKTPFPMSKEKSEGGKIHLWGPQVSRGGGHREKGMESKSS